MQEFRSDYFHAHVYFDPATHAAASALRDLLTHTFPTTVKVYRMIDHPIGPHPQAMFEADFHRPQFEDVVAFLRANRGTLNILVHQNTTDEVWNHSDGALWLGNVQPIDFNNLRAFMAGKIAEVGSKIQTR